MTSVLVGSTVPPYKADHFEYVGAWLDSAEEMKATPDVKVTFMLALEVDARGENTNAELLDRFDEVGEVRHNFMLNTGARTVTSHERLNRICTGRNLIANYASEFGFDAVLYLDSDTSVPGDSISRLLEVPWPMVAGHVGIYGLDGPRVKSIADIKRLSGTRPEPADEMRKLPPGDLRAHWTTAGFLMVKRPLLQRLRWRWDLSSGMTDDPCFQQDARELFHAETIVLHDLVGYHRPSILPSIESRGHNLTIHN
jgi:hypothetical protein